MSANQKKVAIAAISVIAFVGLAAWVVDKWVMNLPVDTAADTTNSITTKTPPTESKKSEQKEPEPLFSLSIKGKNSPLKGTIDVTRDSDEEWKVSSSFGAHFGQLEFTANVPVLAISTKDGVTIRIASLNPKFNAEYKAERLEIGQEFTFAGMVFEAKGDVGAIVSATLSSVTVSNNRIIFAPLSRSDWSNSRVSTDPRFQVSDAFLPEDPQLGNEANDLFAKLKARGDVKWSNTVVDILNSAKEKGLNKAGLGSIAFNGSAEQLAREFHDDKEAAQRKYSWQKVRLELTISPMSTFPSGALSGPPCVIVWGNESNGQTRVECQFSSTDADQIKDLKVGQHVFVEGRCAGLLLGGVCITSCKFVK